MINMYLVLARVSLTHDSSHFNIELPLFLGLLAQFPALPIPFPGQYTPSFIAE